MRMVEDGRANKLGTQCLSMAETDSGRTVCEDHRKISDVGKNKDEQNCPVRADVVH